MSELYAYKNVVDGQTYVFPAERPDLDARPNFERVDVDDVNDAGAIDAALRAKAQADSIAAAAKTRETQQSANDDDKGSSDLAGGQLMPSLGTAGVFGVASSGEPPKGGVLSRGVVKSPYSRAELEAKAQADSDSLESAGVLAAHVDNDLSQVALPGSAQGVVVSAEPTDKAKAARGSAKGAARSMNDKTASFATPVSKDKPAAGKPAASSGTKADPGKS
jgi:hypothetical protein